MSQVEKISKKVRSGVDGEYDLANYDGSTMVDLVKASFGSPILADGAFKISLIVGGGKKVRSKYQDSLPKDLISALVGIGFVEDSGAYVSMDCQGTFKYQHNTDTDLKTMHVFPRITLKSGNSADGNDGDQSNGNSEQSPEQFCISCTFEEFQQAVAVKVKSFGQKRVLHGLLKNTATEVARCDTKMIAMETLTPSEESMYNTATEVADKLVWLIEQTQAHINDGDLTYLEKARAVEQSNKKIKQIEDELEQLDAAKSGKKVIKLTGALGTFRANHSELVTISPVKKPMLHGAKIAQLEALIAVLQRKIDTNSATFDQMQEHSKAILTKARLEAEQHDAHWFVDPSLVEEVAQPKPNKTLDSSQRKGGCGGGAKWATVSTSKKGKSSSGISGNTKKASNAFAALEIGGSDSD